MMVVGGLQSLCVTPPMDTKAHDRPLADLLVQQDEVTHSIGSGGIEGGDEYDPTKSNQYLHDFLQG